MGGSRWWGFGWERARAGRGDDDGLWIRRRVEQPSGNVMSQTIQRESGAVSLTQSYTYDELNRLSRRRKAATIETTAIRL